MALIGRGTASYRAGSLPRAVEDYRAALRIDGAHVAARNNLAVALLESGCTNQARAEINRIDTSQLRERMKAEVLDTRRQIDAKPPAEGSAAACGPTAP